jgi:hypothetical protein
MVRDLCVGKFWRWQILAVLMLDEHIARLERTRGDK